MRGTVTIAHDDGSASPHILWEQWRLARVFKRYKRLVQMDSHIVNQRHQGSFGILAHSDPLAIKYQQRVAWRKEVIEAHFEGRTPNQYVKTWYRPNPLEAKRKRCAAMRAPAPSVDGVVQLPVLDACCGSRMFWFDHSDPRAVFVDKRAESHTLPDVSSKGGSRELIIAPDVQADFTALPFADATFAHVVFDPPHFERNGARSWVGLKYGTLEGDWQEMLRLGFAECFRVLKPEGTLVFKWCADEIPVSRILALTPERPLYGHKSGKQQKTHWITFIKLNPTVEGRT